MSFARQPMARLQVFLMVIAFGFGTTSSGIASVAAWLATVAGSCGILWWWGRMANPYMRPPVTWGDGVRLFAAPAGWGSLGVALCYGCGSESGVAQVIAGLSCVAIWGFTEGASREDAASGIAEDQVFGFVDRCPEISAYGWANLVAMASLLKWTNWGPFAGIVPWIGLVAAWTGASTALRSNHLVVVSWVHVLFFPLSVAQALAWIHGLSM